MEEAPQVSTPKESGPKFLSPETAEVKRKIEEALEKGDFNTVAQLATTAASLEAKAQYNLDVARHTNKEAERAQEAIHTLCSSLVSKYQLLLKDTKRNPFLNPDY